MAKGKAIVAKVWLISLRTETEEEQNFEDAFCFPPCYPISCETEEEARQVCTLMLAAVPERCRIEGVWDDWLAELRGEGGSWP